MTASFNLTLDTQAPANPTLLLNEGAARTGARAVWVRVSTTDFAAGANDVSEMKLWGDVDPGADPAIQPLEGDAGWVLYEDQIAVMLSEGVGRKHVYAKLRDDVGNETLAFTDFIDYDPAVPVVDITTAVDRGRISKVAPFDTATFTWEASIPFDRYEVRVVPNHGSPAQAGVPIGVTGGSVNTSGSGAFDAREPMVTTIRGTDLELASPGNTAKVIKVFVRTTDGTWSA